MNKIDFSVVNEAIRRFYDFYPDGGNWGDTMFDFHNKDYIQSQLALQFLMENKILQPWGDADLVILSPIGKQIVEQFDGDVIKYLEYEKERERKAEAEHKLEMDVHRSTLKSNRIQFWATIVNIIVGIVNIVCAILNYIGLCF